MKKKFLVLFVLLLIEGCSSGGPKFSSDTINAKKDMGIVVFYRPHQFLGGLDFRWGIEASGKKITGLRDSTYSVVKLSPGKYQFYARTSRIDTVEPIEINEGTIQYIKVSQKGASYWTYIVLKEKSEAEALPELNELSMQVNRESWAKKYQYSSEELDENKTIDNNEVINYSPQGSVDVFEGGNEYYSPQDDIDKD